MCFQDAGLLALTWVVDIAHKLAIPCPTAVPISMEKRVNVSLTVQALTQTSSPMKSSFVVRELVHKTTKYSVLFIFVTIHVYNYIHMIYIYIY